MATKLWKSLLTIDKSERIKLLLLAIIFFCIIGGYTLVREMRDSVFLAVVGGEYLAEAKTLATLVLIPAIILYSWLVDRLRRYQLLFVYSLIYSLGYLVFAFFLAHPDIGIGNTTVHVGRVFGWLFYFFVEGYTPFVISLFWAFANSMCSPRSAQQGYPLLVAASKLGGMATALFAWYLCSCQQTPLVMLNSVQRHQTLLFLAAGLLLIVPICSWLMQHLVPEKNLHGYEAVYQYEQQQEKKQSTAGVGVLAGLRLLLRYPYVLGIYGMIFFYEVVDFALNNQRVLAAKSASTCMLDVSSTLYNQIFLMHALGFVIAILGTATLLRLFGERWMLLLVPIVSGILLALTLIFPYPSVLPWLYLTMLAVNMAVTYPVRESLYIPTVKDVRFKSKSWIDGFGTKFAKSAGASFTIFARYVTASHGAWAHMMVHSLFFGTVTALWVLTGYLLGKRYTKAIARNEVIGAEVDEYKA